MVDECKETLERRAVMQVLSRMEFETEIHACAVSFVEDRTPARSEFIECARDQAGGVGWIRVEKRPGEAAGKHRDAPRAEGRSVRYRPPQIMFRLLLARLRVATHRRQSECVHGIVVGRMDGQELACAVSRNVAYCQAVRAED